MKLFAATAAACLLTTMSLQASQFGTGFAVSPKGYLITCYHVVKDARSVVVHTGEGTVPAHIVALDPRNDLAILKVAEWKGRFLGLSSSGEVGYASEVTAAGFPDPMVLGVSPKISRGIVNSLSGIRNDPRFLQVSAPVQPGNSGGPLISPSGRVVGVIAARLNTTERMARGGYMPQTVNYAVKTDLIYPLLERSGISLPKFGTRTGNDLKLVSRALNAVALIEAIRPGQRGPIVQQRPAKPNPNLQPLSVPAERPVPTHPTHRLHPAELQAPSTQRLWWSAAR